MKAKVLITLIIVIGIISLLIGCPDAIYPETTTTISATTTSTTVTTTTTTTTTTTVARIAVSYGATTITAITPITSGDTTVDYGNVAAGNPGFRDITFIITNNGDATLDLNGSSPVDLSGDLTDISTISGFLLQDSGLKTSIKPDGTTDFIITFHSIINSAGYFSATVSIKNNDPDEQDFNFDVTGDAAMGG